MWGPLFLDEGLVIPAKIVQNLKGYQVDNIRFLHHQCIVKKQNVVLNYAKKMNPAQEISALLGSLELPSPSLFITQNAALPKWHQELSKCNLEVLTPDELIKNAEDESESNNPNAVILTHDKIRHAKKLPVDEWFFLVFDDIDKLISSRYIKNIPAQHYVAITLHNFVIDTNPSMLWNIIKWINPKFSEEKDSFIKFDQERRDNLLDLFPEFWRRVTWFLTGEEPEEDDNHEETPNNIKTSQQNLNPINKIKKTKNKRSVKQLKENKRFSRRKITEVNSSQSNNFSSDESNNTPTETLKNKLNNRSTKTEEKYKPKISKQKEITHLCKKTENKNNFEILETTSMMFSDSVNDQNLNNQNNSVPEDDKPKEENTSLAYENDILNSLLFIDGKHMKVDKLSDEARKKLERELDKSNCDKDRKSYTETELNVISSQQLKQSSFTEDISFSENDDRNFILDLLVDSPQENNYTHSFEDSKCSILDSLL